MFQSARYTLTTAAHERLSPSRVSFKFFISALQFGYKLIGGWWRRKKAHHSVVILCSDELKVFREEGVFNYSTMLMREDLGVLLLGAREAVYALDINNISARNAVVGTHPDSKD